MHTVQINLNSIDKVKAFVHSVNTFNTEFDLVSGRFVIDAKSIMGIFSLDLSKPINLTIYNDDDAEIMESLKPVSYTHLDVYKRQLYGCPPADTHPSIQRKSLWLSRLPEPPQASLFSKALSEDSDFPYE